MDMTAGYLHIMFTLWRLMYTSTEKGGEGDD
jgi:hypothetical protein